MTPQIAAQLQTEIQTEQDHGRQKYGGSSGNLALDDSHTDDEWASYIADHNERARLSPPMERRQHLIKVAGLAVSAVESIDRKIAARLMPNHRCADNAVDDGETSGGECNRFKCSVCGKGWKEEVAQ